MKHALLALPAVALFATGALAQTDTTTGAATGTDASTTAGADAQSYGTNWPLSVGTTFFTDAESSTLRTTDEMTGGWQSLSQEDRDMIKADCVTFMAAHGDAATGTSTDASTSTSTNTATDTTAGASTDTGAAASTDTTAGASTDTGTAASTDTTAGAATDTATGTASTEGTIATAVGYDMTEMKAICEAVGTL